MSVITLKSRQDLASLSVKEVCKADIIIASLDLFIAPGGHWGVIGQVRRGGTVGKKDKKRENFRVFFSLSLFPLKKIKSILAKQMFYLLSTVAAVLMTPILKLGKLCGKNTGIFFFVLMAI